jgi:tRNA/rRNA methyltransferase
MNLPEINTSVFKRLRFVLVETSRPGNIGAVARAMKTMGFTQLVLVSPRFADALQHEEAVAFASGAQDVLAGARVVATVAEALEGCNFAAAVSARLREFSPPVLTPRQLGALLAEGSAREVDQEAGTEETESAAAGEAAVIFGNERFGLPNQVVEQCNVLINIPANPDYSSLNLAQAAQVLAYECRMAALEAEAGAKPAVDGISPDTAVGQAAGSGGSGAAIGTGAEPGRIGFRGEPAGLAQIEGMYEHLERALVAIDFLDAANPKKLMPRLKRLFSRAQLETEEVNILRGIARQILASVKAR